MEMQGKKMLVVSAHPGDLLWRCSGAIAKHVKEGGTVDVVIVTYGTGGEANEVMKLPGMTVEQCKAERKRDTEKAADILGVRSIEFFDCEDYPFEGTKEQHRRLAKKIRMIEPDLILTHHEYDYCNPDHGSILKYVITSCEIAGGYGIEIEGTITINLLHPYSLLSSYIDLIYVNVLPVPVSISTVNSSNGCPSV